MDVELFLPPLRMAQSSRSGIVWFTGMVVRSEALNE
jgi:hypothetical protein